MTVSLLSRFQGAWLGALVGEALTSQVQQHGYSCYAPLSQGFWSASQTAALTIAEELLKPPPVDDSSMPVTYANYGNTVLLEAALLPIVLLYGDQPAVLDRAIEQRAMHTGLSLKQRQIVAHSIALVLHCPNLDQVLSHLSVQPIPVMEQECLERSLPILEDLLRRGASLVTAQDRLGIIPLHHRIHALALYCFLSTPDHGRLCFQRALVCDSQPEIAVVTGALVGAYHGISGIPIEWRQAMASANLTTLLTLATRLFACWCGASPSLSLDSTETLAIGAAGVLKQ